jgi:hypothetical protein
MSRTGLSPSLEYLSRSLPLSLPMPRCGPATRPGKPGRLGCSPFARRYLGNRLRFLFLRVLRCFTSPGIAFPDYEFIRKGPGMTPVGFPHSEIVGSKCVCHSPTLIAAYHVLHRLQMPRHSPCARISLTINRSSPSCLRCNCIYPSYAIFKEPPPCGGNSSRTGPRVPGGRAWIRTRDLVLIRDAL